MGRPLGLNWLGMEVEFSCARGVTVSKPSPLGVGLLFAVSCVLLQPAPSWAQAQPTIRSETVTIDLNAPSHPFPHYWERMFGSGRAILSLRDSYRSDLRKVKQATGFEYIRFHAIFHDEVGLYDEDAAGNPVYNFSYVDQIYDGLLQNGVRPFVELSFMPAQAGGAADHASILVPPDRVATQRLGQMGRLSHSFRAASCRLATASTKSPNGISRFGMSRTSIFGPAIRAKKPTISFTILRRARSKR